MFTRMISVGVLALTLAACGGGSYTSSTAKAPDATAEASADSLNLTISQSNAVEKAISYLEYTAFSKKGLVKQLEFEGFTTADAEFAASYIDVDWFEQAALKAASYLDFSSFSRKGLIDQLIFEGFTREEAVYGVDQTGL
jgi:colicin import membrane protein